jgi:hypothetical protein
MNFTGFELIKVGNGVVVKAYTGENQFKYYVANDFQASTTVIQGLLNGTITEEDAASVGPNEQGENTTTQPDKPENT